MEPILVSKQAVGKSLKWLYFCISVQINDPYFCLRVCLFMWCIPERVSVSWVETWDDLSMCFLPWGHDGGYPQVPACIRSYTHHYYTLNCHRYALKSRYVFRPGAQGTPLPARAILSMAGLSHGVIRVNTEDKNSALTVQDVGHVMPGGKTPQPFKNFTVDHVSMTWTFAKFETNCHLGNY